jgi:hypothetical protein
MFDLHGEAWSSGRGRMASLPSLDTGFLVRADHEFVLSEPAIFPTSLIEIQYRTGFRGEIGVSRKNPTSMLPGTDGVFTEPAPDGGVTDGGNESGSARVLGKFCRAPARKRDAQGSRQFAGDGLNFDEQLWGEKLGDARDEAVLPALGVVARRTSFATGSRLHAACSDFARFRRWKDPLLQAKSFSRARLENTVTYISELALEVPVFLETSTVSCTYFPWALSCSPHQYETGLQENANDNT